MFLLCMAEVHGCFQLGLESVTRCQEAVMNKDSENLLRELIGLKSIIDQLPFVFHKISVNPNAGEQFANPVEVRSLMPQLCVLTSFSGARDMLNSARHYRSAYQHCRV